ncbi:MAG: hypothetical protein ABR915_15330 [Thermoguttaceae bacterium]|jgi:hypothetical protein
MSILLGSALLLGGCGKGNRIERLPVSGSVSAPDGDLVSGSITFLPAEGRPGPAATANLVDGRYRFDRSNGPTAGPHRVIVNRIISKREGLENRNAKQPTESAKPPADPKMQWTLSADLTDDGIHKCNLTLSP